MNKDDILQGLSEIFFYNCHKCGQGNLSRDEVHHLKSGEFMCLKCWYKDAPKSNEVDE